MKQLGKRIRNKREELGLTAEDLGRKLGVNKSTISKWERAEVEHIKRSYINEMSEIFNCSPEWLMGFGDDDIEKHIDPTYYLINELWKELNMEQRNTLVQTAKIFVISNRKEG